MAASSAALRVDDDEHDDAPQFHDADPTSSPHATGSIATEAAAVASAYASTSEPVLRVHGLEAALAEERREIAAAAAPAPSSATAASASVAGFGKGDDATLGPAPGPSMPASSVKAAQEVQQESQIAVTITAPTQNGVSHTDASAAAAAPASSSAAPFATSAPSISSAPPAPRNPHSETVAAALLPFFRQVRPSTSSAAEEDSSLEALLAQVNLLSYDAKTALFTHATTPSPAASKLFAAVTEYFLAPAAGSGQDYLCRFLYESAWQASTKALAAAAAPAASAAAAASPPLAPAHLFLLNFLPVLIWRFLAKSQSASSTQPPSSYAGLMAVFLALYNTERVLQARSPGGQGILARPPLPDIPALKALLANKSTGADFLASSAGPSHPPPQAQPTLTVLPAITEPTPAHVQIVLHVLLLKLASALPSTLPETQEALVYLAGLATDSGLVGGGQLFSDVLRLSGSARTQIPVAWNTRWQAAATDSKPTLSTRYVLSSDVLQALVVGLMFALRQASPSAGAAGASRPDACSWHDFVLVALRQVHCRSLEELLPEVLLQTTCLLQQEEELALAQAPAYANSP